MYKHILDNQVLVLCLFQFDVCDYDASPEQIIVVAEVGDTSPEVVLANALS